MRKQGREEEEDQKQQRVETAAEREVPGVSNPPTKPHALLLLSKA